MARPMPLSRLLVRTRSPLPTSTSPASVSCSRSSSVMKSTSPSCPPRRGRPYMPNRCVITELITDQCGHCIEKERGYPYDSIDRVDVGVIIKANYDGKCGQCGKRYEAGAEIGRSDECGWVLMECCGTRAI